MLVLSRKERQSFIIDLPTAEGVRQIRITVLAIIPSRVKVGIEAPKELPVYREELKKT